VALADAAAYTARSLAFTAQANALLAVGVPQSTIAAATTNSDRMDDATREAAIKSEPERHNAAQPQKGN
jgi:hypothetical protein